MGKREKNDTRDFWNDLVNRAGNAAAIDPHDRTGRKNAYIGEVRDRAVLSAIPIDATGSLLDFGCGTIDLMSAVSERRSQLEVFGVDISAGMLRSGAEKHPQLRDNVVLYDGSCLPITDHSVNFITTTGALVYLTSALELDSMLREFHRILRPGGVLVAVEQVRRVGKDDARNFKYQRTPSEFTEAFARSGFLACSFRQVRRGHFPFLYLMQSGFAGAGWMSRVAAVEEFIWRKAPLPILDYADAVFVCRKIEV